MAPSSAAPVGPASAETEDLPAFLRQPSTELSKRFLDLDWDQKVRMSQAQRDTNLVSQWSRLSGEDILKRNRYQDIDPWQYNRVKLRVEHESENDYINASRIFLRCAKDDAEKQYIATQGPKDLSIAHFYQMLWHETRDPAVVVMLTQTHEQGREKCFQYYPVREPLKVESGSFKASIDLISTRNDESTNSTIRELRIKLGNKTKTIWHYLFEGWPDFGIPEGDNRTALLELVKQTAEKASIPQQSNADGLSDAPNPRIVHCSAGVGRSGTFIALDYLLSELEDGSLDNVPKDVDRIATCVDDLRKQRMMMVQGEVQFLFLYDVLKEQWLERHKNMKERNDTSM